jgi:predicted TIM-barrel enzyme
MAGIEGATRCDDFCTASPMERLPTGQAMSKTTSVREIVQ